MNAFPPPVPVEPLQGRRGLKRWPLWAKISAPIVTLLIVSGTATALGGNADKGTAPADTQAKVLPLAADSATTAAVTTAPTTTEAPTTTRSATTTTQRPTTTVASTTAVPTTVAPTTPPPTKPVTTPPPTPPPTAAAILPPAIAPTLPPPPSTPPPTAAPQPATDPRFGTCKEAKANGYGPYFQGQDPEYSWYRDADKDGIVCE